MKIIREPFCFAAVGTGGTFHGRRTMPRAPVSIVVTAAAVCMLSACAGPRYSFEVEITNATPGPLAAGFVKYIPGGQRPGLEEGWTAPEDVAINAPPLTDRRWGRLIPAGRTVVLGPQKGRFPEGIRPMLRVYAGDYTIDELLAFRRDDPDRLDIHLWPGRSSYVITMENGRLSAKRREGS